MTKTKVLLLYRRTVVSDEVIALIEHFLKNSQIEVILCISETSLLRNLPETVLDQISIHLMNGQKVSYKKKLSTGSLETGHKEKRSYVHKIRNLILASSLLSSILFIKNLLRAQRYARNLYQSLLPDTVFVFDDRTPLPEMIFIQLANERNISTVTIPFASSNVESDVFTRRHKPLHHINKGMTSFLKKMIVRKYPNQVIEFENEEYLFFNLWDSLVLSFFGLLNTKAWYYGAGATDATFLFGQEDYELLARQVDSDKKLFVTGQPSLDSLAAGLQDSRQKIKHELNSHNGFDVSKPILVCAVPHYAEHGQLDWEEHWKVTKDLLAAVKNSGANVVISLHPKSKPENYKGLCEEYGVYLIDKPLREVMPVADIFVSGYSSTVRWATMIGIATVISDLGYQKYAMYDRFIDMPRLCEKEPLSLELKKMVDDPDYRSRVSESLKKESFNIAVFDGKACERIENLVMNRLVGSK